MNIDRQLGFQLGEWSVHPDQGLLVGVKGELHLEPKVMEVLTPADFSLETNLYITA